MTEKTQPWTDEQRRDIHESVSWMAKQTRQGPDYHTIKAQRDALLEAAKEAEPMLQAMLDSIRKTLPQYTKMPALEKLRAAIKAVEGEA